MQPECVNEKFLSLTYHWYLQHKVDIGFGKSEFLVVLIRIKYNGVNPTFPTVYVSKQNISWYLSVLLIPANMFLKAINHLNFQNVINTLLKPKIFSKSQFFVPRRITVLIFLRCWYWEDVYSRGWRVRWYWFWRLYSNHLQPQILWDLYLCTDILICTCLLDSTYHLHAMGPPTPLSTRTYQIL